MGILENEEVAGRVRWHAVDMVEREDRWMRERAIEGLPLLAEIDHRHHSFDSCLSALDRAGFELRFENLCSGIGFVSVVV
jgi:hypothetical protein